MRGRPHRRRVTDIERLQEEPAGAEAGVTSGRCRVSDDHDTVTGHRQTTTVVARGLGAGDPPPLLAGGSLVGDQLTGLVAVAGGHKHPRAVGAHLDRGGTAPGAVEPRGPQPLTGLGVVGQRRGPVEAGGGAAGAALAVAAHEQPRPVGAQRHHVSRPRLPRRGLREARRPPPGTRRGAVGQRREATRRTEHRPPRHEHRRTVRTHLNGVRRRRGSLPEGRRPPLRAPRGGSSQDH